MYVRAPRCKPFWDTIISYFTYTVWNPQIKNELKIIRNSLESIACSTLLNGIEIYYIFPFLLVDILLLINYICYYRYLLLLNQTNNPYILYSEWSLVVDYWKCRSSISSFCIDIMKNRINNIIVVGYWAVGY